MEIARQIAALNIEEEEIPGRPPHEALFLALAYLPVYELIVMSKVCKTLKDAVNKDVLPWLNVIIDNPLSSRLRDGVLIKIASKADGRLKTLALINCTNITDDGLQHVMQKSPLINKLYVPRCTRLTPEGIIAAVRTHSSIQFLEINGIYNITKQHLDSFHSYLPIKSTHPQPLLYYHDYRNRNISRHVHDKAGRILDVEICPRCNEVNMVFECPKETCKRLPSSCKGCKFCIPRCEECGGCVGPDEVEDTICADTLCSNCWLKLPKCAFCNKPYCRLHSSYPGSSQAGFVCDVCTTKYITSTHEDDD
ncbi:hypothetical protein ACFE04_001302 [Oxalis oulophora]